MTRIVVYLAIALGILGGAYFAVTSYNEAIARAERSEKERDTAQTERSKALEKLAAAEKERVRLSRIIQSRTAAREASGQQQAKVQADIQKEVNSDEQVKVWANSPVPDKLLELVREYSKDRDGNGGSPGKSPGGSDRVPSDPSVAPSDDKRGAISACTGC